ncbi:UNVERIFIED_CONTAM: Plant intracellular Ras-group-related LRR protein 6 [Sesamum calycinum]|uniref:Plant intracellular Ras-group-related LRR protein 6 n=1 Tax=Sesamum calycinum TaxID=2727403 RepID=A0AAW2MAU9_9LAMI
MKRFSYRVMEIADNCRKGNRREVPDDVYKSLDAVGDDEKWWEAVELQKLILAHNDIESLKEDLKNLPLLVVLNVSHNKLTSLPAVIGELHMLKSLDVSFNSIEKIPEEIGSAASLVKFDCSNNVLSSLPCSLGHCINLAELKASNNKISSLPEELANCSKLTKLDIEGNKLEMLSDNVIASCTMLVELNASKNFLSSMPESIGRLSRLVRLDLHQNIEEYPVAACSLHLSVLDLSNNSLSGLPAEIGLMTTLRKLILTGNPMRTLRSSLVHGPTPALLKYLRSRLPKDEESEASTAVKEDVVTRAARLSIGSKVYIQFQYRITLSAVSVHSAFIMCLQSKGFSISSIINFQELSLAGLGLGAVPSEIWKSSDVTKVDLSGNSIEELPSELRSCVSLEALILSKNKIKEWPAELLASLPRLLCLKLDGNPLRKIPSDGFRAASKLQILDLSGTSGSLPENPAFSSLPELQELYLRRMQISSFPLDIMTLQQLRILDLSQNSLQSIPESIKDLTSLTELNLSDNNISSLPPNLGLLEAHLKVLKLEGNPLRSIRRTILDRGTKAILKYLKDRIVEQ